MIGLQAHMIRDKNSDQMQTVEIAIAEQSMSYGWQHAVRASAMGGSLQYLWHELWVAACIITMACAMDGSMHKNYGMCYGWQHARKDAAQTVVSPSQST